MNPGVAWCCACMLALSWSGLPLTAADRLLPLQPREVRVGGEIGRRIAVTITNNLLVLDAERDFLAPFRARTHADGYIGLGKLLDATVRFAAYTGDPRVDALRRKLVGAILELQEPDGYVGMLRPDRRVAGLWDVHEVGYLIWGLLADFEANGDARSLEAARRAADHVCRRWADLPADWCRGTDIAPHVAVTGLERTLLALHRQTGDPVYRTFVERERALPAWDLGIVIGRRSGIEGHAYAYLARCLAQLEMYRLEPRRNLLRQSDRVLDFLLHHEGLMITGGTGQCEIWTDDQDGRGDLAETCATAYQLRVYDSLLRLRADARLGDLMERTIYNTLFAAQSPDGRRLRYFSPVEGNRVYWEGDSYCCPCNYRRIVAELPGMVAYRSGRGLAVNLYSEATVQCPVADGARLRLEMSTAYPSDGAVRLQIGLDRPSRFPLRLRIPAWAKDARIRINGQPEGRRLRPGTFADLDRSWNDGDRVDLDLPMEWRLVRGRQRQAGRVAVMRGPQVFCLDPSAQPDLAAVDGTELGYLAVNPASLGAPVASDAVRPGGLACRVEAWKAGFGVGAKADYHLTLTEFADPRGRATYFRVRDPAVAVDDELMGPGR